MHPINYVLINIKKQKVYDIDGDGSISKDEMRTFFEHSIMIRDDNKIIKELSDFFIAKIYSEMDTNTNDTLSIEEARSYITAHPEIKDIYGLFGRSMATGDDGALMDDALRDKSLLEVEEERLAMLDNQQQRERSLLNPEAVKKTKKDQTSVEKFVERIRNNETEVIKLKRRSSVILSQVGEGI